MQDFHPGCSLQTLLGTVTGWKVSPGCKAAPWFHLPLEGCDSRAVHNALAQLLDHRAVFGSDAFLDVDIIATPWAQLLRNEYLRIVDGSEPPAGSDAVALTTSKVQLSQLGITSLRTGACFEASQPVFAPRTALPLKDCTPFELGMILQERGWQWQLMPRKVKDRQGLAHDTNQAVGAWYTLGKTILPAYARCLLSCTELRERHGLQMIPHYTKRPLKDYELLLQGKPIPTAEPTHRQALQDFQQEFPEDVPIEFHELVDHEGGGDESEEDVEYWLGEILDGEDIALQDEMPDPPVEPDNELEPPAPADEDEPQRPRKQRRGRDPKRGELCAEQWGCFEIARKRAGDVETALECRCKFHRLNDQTGCKRTISYTAESDDHVRQLPDGGATWHWPTRRSTPIEHVLMT